MFPKPISNLLAWYGKTKPNTTKAHTHQSREMQVLQHKIPVNAKKLKSSLVTSYDIWPGNGEGLPILLSALHKFVTY